ncbi:MAG: SDR family oxidoreductase [Elusimicrobia bacterium]|nr:SDR family oxidoreductase [Elusimicrobiota bacterium]
MSASLKCVVTGGAGFIGSHLAERLLADGHRVTVIDNFSTGRPENLEHLKGNDRLRLVQSDIRDFGVIAPHFKDALWVFHLAALADIVPSIERPTDYFNANVVGTQSVLEAARAAGVKRFIYAASSSCYGIPDRYPTPESAEIRPQYPYALTKRLGEELALHWGQVYGMPVISTRFFNVYGPRSRTSGTYGAVFGVFLAQKIHGKPFTVVGDGEQTRDFTFVADVAAALVRAAESDVSGEIFNVGSGSTYSVNRLVELLGGPAVRIPKRPGEPDCTFADIAKITRVLGWKPSVSLEDGVKRMLENIDYWRQAPVWTPQSIEKATKAWFDFLEPAGVE